MTPIYHCTAIIQDSDGVGEQTIECRSPVVPIAALREHGPMSSSRVARGRKKQKNTEQGRRTWQVGVWRLEIAMDAWQRRVPVSRKRKRGGEEGQGKKREKERKRKALVSMDQIRKDAWLVGSMADVPTGPVA